MSHDPHSLQDEARNAARKAGRNTYDDHLFRRLVKKRVDVLARRRDLNVAANRWGVQIHGKSFGKVKELLINTLLHAVQSLIRFAHHMQIAPRRGLLLLPV